MLEYCNPEEDIKAFWEKNSLKIKKFYLEQKKSDDVIISASPRFLLEPVCHSLGIRNLICSEVDVKTGKFDGLNCWGEEKVVRFRKVFGNVSPEEFYSDSLSDTPMAKISKTAFIVKGEEILPWK